MVRGLFTTLAAVAVATEPSKNIVELAQSVDDLSTLVTAVVAADLVDTLSSPGPFTVFAPTNAGFGALPAGTLDTLLAPENKGQLVDILTFHVVPKKLFAKDFLSGSTTLTSVEGGPLYVQSNGLIVRVLDDLRFDPADKPKYVRSADNEATNGVVHVIDGVLLPRAARPTPAPTLPNIVELAQSVDDLSTLVTAVVAADLVDTLSATGPFTVFAPINDGFSALPAGTLDTLLKPENKGQLVDILTWHVVPDQVLSTDLPEQALKFLKTVQGSTLSTFKDSKGVRVKLSTGAVSDFKRVTAADNLASNGVVHLIDGVILAPSELVV